MNKIIFLIGIFSISCKPSDKSNNLISNINDSTKIYNEEIDTIHAPIPMVRNYGGENLDSIKKSRRDEYTEFPEFPGGWDDSFQNFMKQKLIIPNEIKGKYLGIDVGLRIDTKGRIVKINYWGNTHGCKECENAILKFIKEMPQLKPALQINTKFNKIQPISMDIDIEFRFFGE